MTRMRRRARALLTALLVLAPAAADGQQVPEVLTLEDALRIAKTGNPAFRRTENDLELASNAIRQAWGAFLPTLQPSISFSGSRSATLTGQDPFGSPVRLDTVRHFRSSSTSQNLGIGGVTVFDGGANIRNVRAQRANYQSVEASIRQQELLLEAQVSREFYQAVRAARIIALEERLLASLRTRLDRTEELMRLAARNQVDVLGARADVAQGELSVDRARGDADKARLGLAATLGMSPDTPFRIDTVLPPVFDPANLDVDGLVAQALATHPQILQREAVVEAARHRAAAAKGRRLPSVSANVSYGRSMGLSSYEAFTQFNPQNWSFSFGFGVSLPLFTRFQTSSAIAEAEAAATDARHDLRQLQLNTERDVRSAVIDLANAYRALELAEYRAEVSRARDELAQEQYRLGGIGFTELQQIFDATANAERQALEARFTFVNAQIALEERIGSRLEE